MVQQGRNMQRVENKMLYNKLCLCLHCSEYIDNKSYFFKMSFNKLFIAWQYINSESALYSASQRQIGLLGDRWRQYLYMQKTVIFNMFMQLLMSKNTQIINATVVAYIYLNLPGSTFCSSTFKGGDLRDESQSLLRPQGSL